MTYLPAIPQAQQSPAGTASVIQTNFAQFDTIFANNHTALNDKNEGDHEAVIFEKQIVDPSVTEDLAVLYNKDATSNLGTQPQLFSRIQKFLPTTLDPNTETNAPIQLTYNTVNTAGPQFQSFLPGGNIFYFGMITDITINIVLSPQPTAILMAIAIPNTMTSVGTPIPFDVSTEIISQDTFKIHSTLNAGGPVIPYSFTWMAIASV